MTCVHLGAQDIPVIAGLAINGWTSLRPDIDAAERLVVDVATGRADEAENIAERLRALVV
ncbi:hypothetical protein ACF053_05805 [Streptomyces kanasensis]|uniref:hypothetical protein n=1 Tax=Streptomyces kanasensis TaxID=936756 RepID=UPI0036FFA254